MSSETVARAIHRYVHRMNYVVETVLVAALNSWSDTNAVAVHMPNESVASTMNEQHMEMNTSNEVCSRSSVHIAVCMVWHKVQV